MAFTDARVSTPRAMLIDLDDTILDDGAGVAPAWRSATEQAASQVPGLDTDRLYVAISDTRDWFWSDPERHREGRADLRAASRRVVHEALLRLGLDLPDLATQIAESYRDMREPAIRPFPGAIETLARLRDLKVSLCLLTNGAGPAQRAKIDRFDLARHFDHVLIEGEFGAGKPDDRVHLAAMKAVGSSPSETWCVGDNLEWEVAAPQRLGIYSVWVDASRNGLPDGTEVGPDRIVSSLSDLL